MKIVVSERKYITYNAYIVNGTYKVHIVLRCDESERTKKLSISKHLTFINCGMSLLPRYDPFIVQLRYHNFYLIHYIDE